ncbi:MAG: hypothetical protein MUP11_12375 [Anaerolineales bacterium]|nr:hypothetical protein [Anaerolineales bacterium]
MGKLMDENIFPKIAVLSKAKTEQTFLPCGCDRVMLAAAQAAGPVIPVITVHAGVFWQDGLPLIPTDDDDSMTIRCQSIPDPGNWRKHVINQVIGLLQSQIIHFFLVDDTDSTGAAVLCVKRIQFKFLRRADDHTSAAVFVWEDIRIEF